MGGLIVLSVLIVDDETSTRALLTEFIPWEKYGFDKVYTAENGVVAAKMVSEIHPDLMISDIVMPKMNGFELLSIVKEIAPSCMTILLSGYSGKENLIKAIRLNVVDFLEKPIDIESTCKLIESVSKKIKLEKEKLSTSYKQELLINQLCSESSSENQVPFELIDEYKLSHYKYHNVILVENLAEQHYNDSISLYKTLYESADISILISEWSDKKSFFTVIISSNYPAETVEDNLKAFIKECSLKKIPFICALGSTVTSVAEIYQSFQYSEILIKYSFYCTDRCTLLKYSHHNDDYKFDEKIICQLKKSLFKKDFFESKNILQKYFKEVYENTPSNHDYIRNTMYLILCTFDSYIADKSLFSLDKNEREICSSYIWKLVASFHKFTEFQRYIMDLTSWVCDFSCGNIKETTIKKLIKYIEDNISDYNLGVESVAEYMHLTSSYTCQIFKKSTGTTINHFITDTRIKKAKYYLVHTSMPISDITEKVGYSDSKYFSKIFKQKEGLTPSEYRRNNV